MASFRFAGFGGLVLLAAVALSGFAHGKEIILTNASAGKFLGSLAEMQVLAASEGAKAGIDGKNNAGVLQGLLKAIKSTTLKAEAATVAAKHGFSNIQEWTDTGRAIAQAYIYVSAGKIRDTASGAVEKHKDSAAKQIEKLGILNEKQKKKLRDNLESVSESLSKEPPPENIKVINAIKPLLDAALKALKGSVSG